MLRYISKCKQQSNILKGRLIIIEIDVKIKKKKQKKLYPYHYPNTFYSIHQKKHVTYKVICYTLHTIKLNVYITVRKNNMI